MRSDQEIIYSSFVLSQIHKDYNITRSMSRIATPIDNSIINGHNNYQPSYALNYKTPIKYRTQLGFQ